MTAVTRAIDFVFPHVFFSRSTRESNRLPHGTHNFFRTCAGTSLVTAYSRPCVSRNFQQSSALAKKIFFTSSMVIGDVRPDVSRPNGRCTIPNCHAALRVFSVRFAARLSASHDGFSCADKKSNSCGNSFFSELFQLWKCLCHGFHKRGESSGERDGFRRRATDFLFSSSTRSFAVLQLFAEHTFPAGITTTF